MLDWGQTHRGFARPTNGHTADAAGLIVGTHIATGLGWRPVEALCIGDAVLTFDHGYQPIKSMTRSVLWDGVGECPNTVRPIRIDLGVLENTKAFYAMPDQGVMVESDAAEDYRGDPFAVIRAAALADFGLCERIYPTAPVQTVGIEFEDDEVVYGLGGAHFFAPKSFDLLGALGSDPESKDDYKILSTDEAAYVLEEIWEQTQRPAPRRG